MHPTRLLGPWDPPGKNTGVACHALFQGLFLTQRSNPCLLSPALAGGLFTTGTTWEISAHVFPVLKPLQDPANKDWRVYCINPNLGGLFFLVNREQYLLQLPNFVF